MTDRKRPGRSRLPDAGTNQIRSSGLAACLSAPCRRTPSWEPRSQAEYRDASELTGAVAQRLELQGI